MASAASFLIFLIFVIFSNSIESKNEFKVGERKGWRIPNPNNTEIYTQWASKNRFRVGDSLYFEYKEDSVLEVDKAGYYHCIITNPIAAFNNGKTTIKLDKPGPIYFISGAPDHCKNGQCLLINVIGLNPPPSSSSSSIKEFPSPSPANSGFKVDNFVAYAVAILTSTISLVLV